MGYVQMYPLLSKISLPLPQRAAAMTVQVSLIILNKSRILNQHDLPFSYHCENKSINNSLHSQEHTCKKIFKL